MTFSARIKDEITKYFEDQSELQIAIAAFLQFSSIIEKNKITITTENASVARWVFKALKHIYNVEIKLTVRTIKRFKLRNIYILEIKEKIDLIHDNIKDTLENILNTSVEEKKSFLKGLFLSCGSINDPKTNQYHLEFLIKNFAHAKLINKIFINFDFKSKIIKREKEYMVYIKVSENISDFIKYLGATNALFYFEDIRIYKDHKNMVNRLNNCEQANYEKTMQANQKILESIKFLIDHDLLSVLDDRSKEIIEYKKKYEDTSFLELAKIVSMETGKSISKSGINHHFRKINAIVAHYNSVHLS